MRPAGGGSAGEPRDRGVSLVEVLVGMALFGVLGTLLLGFVIATSKVTDDTRRLSGVNEESRLAMERFARELRQTSEILSFQLPVHPATDPIALKFWTDFDGDGAQDTGAVDPEVLTYRWDPTTKRLTLSASAVTEPVLAVNVSAFDLQLYSSLWEYDHDGTDGMTTWQEIDQYAPVGNKDGVPDPAELDLVDLVDVTMTVLDGSHRQTYTTEVDLRNRNQN